MKVILTVMVLALSCAITVSADGHISKSAANTQIYFISPMDGQTVGKKFKVQFGLAGMGVAPAGIKKENTGHHHILIDTDIATIDLSNPIPATEKIRHFGGGQTETMLELSPGEHTLQLLLGNYAHIPHDRPVFSKKITITVQ